ncbi:GNAT family N-acetyltransferase [Thalassotalea psychrophila]|uniref:GNAT family N-acetyltransferase n=1 Tax=Thalassotalea psychrophila TaxID=3065647 RepID=A0ABY9TWE9_9GAMM|nr:GNAT family N-acetyltransferase [Colwelliaceae bacterium SQ149]
MSDEKQIIYRPMNEIDFDNVIALGNFVHGDGYMSDENIITWFKKGLKDQLNSNFVAYDGNKIVGFRVSYSPGNYLTDQWYSPHLWQTDIADTAYFKCNTVDENYRGFGIGSKLLNLSVQVLKQQGAKAGVSHLWRQSPGNSAVKYFTKCGGVLVKDHPDKWYQDSIEGYKCAICKHDCHCVAAEMIIYFD